jgi:TetR/AcrR family tetracycline transcriptional repressor
MRPETVVAAALALVDEAGLENLTMRRLASRLSVQPPALYRQVRSKRDLVDEIAQAILSAGLSGLAPAQDPSRWDSWLSQMAHLFRAALLSHRDGARIVAGAGIARAVILAELVELSLGVLTRAGFGIGTASQATTTVLAYTIGHAIEEQAGPAAEDAPQPGLLIPRFPLIAAAISSRAEETPAVSYDHGLQLIISGLRHLPDLSPGPPARQQPVAPGTPPAGT